MTTKTLYHVTDASNTDSIKSEGLKAGFKNFVFFTDSETEAERIGEIYDNIDEPVVFEVKIMEHKLQDDPEPHGDLNSFAHRGDIPAHDVEVVA